MMIILLLVASETHPVIPNASRNYKHRFESVSRVLFPRQQPVYDEGIGKQAV